MRNYDKFIYYAVQASDDDIHGIVESHGLEFVEKIGELDGYFLVSAPKHSFNSLRKRSLLLDNRVPWLQEQIPQKRLFKRVPLKSVASKVEKPNIPAPDEVIMKLGIKDPGFPNQFHLYNRNEKGHDLNLTGVWYQGITGQNVTITLLDDGVDYEHPDIKDNFFAEGSWDFNLHTNLPKPLLWDDYHGTRCAGEVSAVKNDICGIGIAYGSKVGGIRILSGALTIADEAAAITYMHHKNHIYSCSWGPRDDGMTMDKPPKLAAEAFKKGIISGRNGLGTLFVFAAGNGGLQGDNCNFDGYTNSIYTITIGAIEKDNNHPGYSEQCSATLSVTYSGHSGTGMSGIYTTDVHGKCTDNHGGTSAAAPMASGVLALVLSIRPDLTWRDAQALMVETSVPINLDDSGWQTVEKGRKFNHKFGYGKLDGYRIVEAAKTFKNLNMQTSYSSKVIQVDKKIPEDSSGLNSTIEVTAADIASSDLKNLEHVTISINANHARRGDVSLTLISPKGYVSELLTARPHDMSSTGFDDWTTMSVKHWDENPIGVWTINIRDTASNSLTGQLKHWNMTFWGASSRPNIIYNPHSNPLYVKDPKSQDIMKNTTNGSSISVDPNGAAVQQSYFSIVFGAFCLILIVFGLVSASTFWKRISRNKNRSDLASNEQRYVPIEDELDDAFLESQLQEALDEEI